MKILHIIEKGSALFWTLTGFLLILGIGLADYLTGYELAFSLFYLIPISLIAWRTRRGVAIAASVFSAGVWLAADIAARSVYSHSFIYAWNTLIRLSFFVITVLLLSALKTMLEREQALARTDYLTGAVNSRSFYDIVLAELGRSQRYGHPFTLAYMDLDNFKTVNDQYGHSAGDRVLQTVVDLAKTQLRKTDVVARLGGDEFALLLPETGQEAARAALAKLQSRLLEEMEGKHWPITFSIGVLTYAATPKTSDELVKMADTLMYEVKRSGKNAIKYSIFAG